MFSLSPELIDQILFAMEDQSESYVFDTKYLEVKAESLIAYDDKTEEEIGEDDFDRYIDIPEWTSFQGFQLMERFVGGLRNPVYQDALRSALSRGKGVFRHFKNVLKKNEEIERLWYSFKEREMKQAVREWYEALAEVQGLAGLPIDLEHLEETEDLVLTDFLFDSAIGGLEKQLEELDRLAFEEMFPDVGEGRRKSIYERRTAELPAVTSEQSVFTVARTPAGEMSGFAWGVKADIQTFKIVQLYIHPEYRGLGLAQKLIVQLILSLSERGVRHVEIELYGEGIGLGDYLEKEGMSLSMVRYSIETEQWKHKRSG